MTQALGQDDAWAAAAERLQTISGVGQLTAIWLLVTTLNFTLCRTAEEATSHAGLAPHVRLSGSSVRDQQCAQLPEWLGGGGVAAFTTARQGRVQLTADARNASADAGRARLGLDDRGSLGVPASASSRSQNRIVKCLLTMNTVSTQSKRKLL